MPFKQNYNQTTKSKVPLLNLNSGFKPIKSQENNLPQKNINISEINNESNMDRNDISGGESFHQGMFVKQIEYNPEEKAKFTIKIPDNKGKSPQNISFAKKSNLIEEISQISKTEITSPNFTKKIAGKVFMPKLNLKGDRLETSKIGETPFDVRSMILNVEKKQGLKNDKLLYLLNVRVKIKIYWNFKRSESHIEENENFQNILRKEGSIPSSEEMKKQSHSMM